MKKEYILNMAIGFGIAVILTGLCYFTRWAAAGLFIYYFCSVFIACVTNFGDGVQSEWREATTEREGYWTEGINPTPRLGGIASGAFTALMLTVAILIVLGIYFW